MKATFKAFALIGATLFTGSTLATELVCDVNPRGNGQTMGNGTSSCEAFDFSFGNSTSGRYYLKNISKPINKVIWHGSAGCSGGTSCGVTVRAYSGSQQAHATVLYKDGTYEVTNTAHMFYETGH